MTLLMMAVMVGCSNQSTPASQHTPTLPGLTTTRDTATEVPTLTPTAEPSLSPSSGVTQLPTQHPTSTPQPAPGTSTPTPQEISISIDEVVASGLGYALYVTTAGDGSGRLFVVEQTGLIKIIQDGQVLDQPFLDATHLISFGSERGLLGLAFHPQYSENGYFFIDYTDVNGNTTIERYSVSQNPDIADPQSSLLLFKIDQPYANHNGGQLTFGPDGYLYIGMGDGGSANDPHNNGQTLSTPLGAILRIDVDHGSPYDIPPDNPFVNQSNTDPRIWDYGLRNPWRFSFDMQTHDLYIGDVGQDQYEEIDFQEAGSPGGLNFGWRCMEGIHTHNTQPPCNDQSLLNSLTAPILDYSHSVGHSVTGGYVYRGSQFPALDGIYFFGDFVAGKLWSIKLTGRSPFTWTEVKLQLETGFNISSFGQDEQGEIYVVDYSGGTIRHLTQQAAASATP